MNKSNSYDKYLYKSDLDCWSFRTLGLDISDLGPGHFGPYAWTFRTLRLVISDLVKNVKMCMFFKIIFKFYINTLSIFHIIIHL